MYSNPGIRMGLRFPARNQTAPENKVADGLVVIYVKKI